MTYREEERNVRPYLITYMKDGVISLVEVVSVSSFFDGL